MENNLLTDILERTKSINVENIFNAQRDFLQTTLGNTINESIDIWLKNFLPDSIEQDIIDIKNSIICENFYSGINLAIDKIFNFGENFTDIFKNGISSFNELSNKLSENNFIEKISDLLDIGIDFAEKKGWINENISNFLKSGKNMFENIITRNIDKEFEIQTNLFKQLEDNINNWYESYYNQNFEKMEKYYSNISENLDKITPMKEIIDKANYIDNIHNLIKNNGNNFEISDIEKELANVLN